MVFISIIIAVIDVGQSSRVSEEVGSSVFFSRGGGSLVQSDNRNNYDDDSNKEKTFSQDENYFDDASLEKLQFDYSKKSPASTDESMQFSSPSFSSSLRLSSSDSEISKVTPKSDVHSSSSLLRSVHSAGGAHMGRNNEIAHDDVSQDLKPSQLDETLQKAENIVSPPSESQKSSLYRSLIDEIIEETIVDPTKTLMDDFGRFLYERLHLYDTAFVNTTSIALKKIMSDLNVHSYVDVSTEVCKFIGNDIPTVCQNDGIEVLKMTIAFLEQEAMEDCDTGELEKMSTLLQQKLTFDERANLYSNLLDIAVTRWEELESQAFHTVSSCFQLVNQSNFDEKAIMKDLLQKDTKRRINNDDYQKKRSLESFNNMKKQIEKENEDIEKMLLSINDEMTSIRKMRHVSSFLASRVEVERNLPLEGVDLILLKMFLTFSEKFLTTDQVDVSYPHMDEYSSKTLISWCSETSSERRQSFSSVESVDGMTDLLSKSPTITRIRNQKCPSIFVPDNYLLRNGSPAHQMCTCILNDERMNKFLLRRCSQEQETGILTFTDIFQRLNLMATDVMELHKSFNCRVDCQL